MGTHDLHSLRVRVRMITALLCSDLEDSGAHRSTGAGDHLCLLPGIAHMPALKMYRNSQDLHQSHERFKRTAVCGCIMEMHELHKASVCRASFW
jgi:hypothetical protein